MQLNRQHYVTDLCWNIKILRYVQKKIVEKLTEAQEFTKDRFKGLRQRRMEKDFGTLELHMRNKKDRPMAKFTCS